MSTNSRDVLAMIGKGVIGAIPFVGPIAAEIVGNVIPNQRIDRLEILLKELESKINPDEQNKFKEKMGTPEGLDLVEDSFIQASRALSPERQKYIAALLINSLTNEDLEHIESKRLLSLLGELNDLEILMLKSFTLRRSDEAYNEFWEKHEDTLQSPSAHMRTTQKEIDKHTMFQTHKMHLVNIGLLKLKFRKPKRDEVPEFDDKTGMIKANGHDITPLARLLLKAINLYCE